MVEIWAFLSYTEGELALTKGASTLIRAFPAHKPPKHESWDNAEWFDAIRAMREWRFDRGMSISSLYERRYVPFRFSPVQYLTK